MILENRIISFSIIEASHFFININIRKKLTVRPEVFVTDFDQDKKHSLFRMQRNIGKRNQSFCSGNRISFNFGLKTSFEMSETTERVIFLWKPNN